MSIHMTSPQEWTTNIIIIIVTKHPMNKASITKKEAQPMNMSPAPTQPMKIDPNIPTILQRITNKRQWIITI